MFISNYDKEEMRISIRTLQAEMAALIKEVNALREAKTKPAKRSLILRTGEAPWGYKKDGTPKKKPGRHMQLIVKGATA